VARSNQTDIEGDICKCLLRCLGRGTQASRTASVEVIHIDPPAATTLVAPGGASPPGPAISTLVPLLQWTALNDAYQYDVFLHRAPFDIANSGDSFFWQTSSNSFTIPAGILSNGASYMWRVDGIGIGGEGKNSAPLYFTVSVTGPVAPVISAVSPNPARVSPNPAALTITGSNFRAGCTVALRYEGAGLTQPNPQITSQTATTLTILPLFSTQGTWSVAVNNSDGITSGRYFFQVSP
jgi:hypothetical protein